MRCVKGLDINEEVGANLAKSLTDEGYGEGLSMEVPMVESQVASFQSPGF